MPKKGKRKKKTKNRLKKAAAVSSVKVSFVHDGGYKLRPIPEMVLQYHALMSMLIDINPAPEDVILQVGSGLVPWFFANLRMIEEAMSVENDVFLGYMQSAKEANKHGAAAESVFSLKQLQEQHGVRFLAEHMVWISDSRPAAPNEVANFIHYMSPGQPVGSGAR